MIVILFIILFVCMYFIGGDRGVLSFIALCGNLFVLLGTVLLLYIGLHPLVVTIVCGVAVSVITLFYQNGWNVKTKASFLSVMGIMVLLLFIVYPIGIHSHIQGFSEIKQAEEEMIGLSTEIHMNMQQIAISMILMGLIGAILDVSIAVSSSVYEIYQHQPDSSGKALFYAGIHIGGDIIGTTANTLLFAYLSEFLMLFIRFKVGNTTFLQILHSKAFCQEFIRILFSGIGCILIIPVTALTLAVLLKKDKREPV